MWTVNSMKNKLLAVVLVFLAACAAPGPRTQDILGDESAVVVDNAAKMPFAVVAVDNNTAKVATNWLDRALSSGFLRDTGSVPQIIGRGDVLEISIVSTSENGYIDLTNSSLSPISTTSLPAQEVGTDGMVSVPPIGRLRAQGQPVQSFERLLERRLGEVLVDPSVIVRISERRSARVSVLGAVASPGTFPISQNNMHLVEVLAEAGGPTGLSENLELSISRKGSTGRARLDKVYENPAFNIHVLPGDVISVEEPAHRLVVLGAGGVNATLVYNEGNLSLAEALGRASGLVNRRADRRGVFVYREISAKAARDLGVDISKFDSGPVPTIFNVDLSEPEALFAAKTFRMGPSDLIYISNSANEEIAALFSVFTNFAPTPAEYIRDATISSSN